MKKFEFTGETKTFNLGCRTVTLHRIRAIKNFGRVKAGDFGGWIEREKKIFRTKAMPWLVAMPRFLAMPWLVAMPMFMAMPKFMAMP